ncbi:MAG TPA: carboxypeptidase-like regulatory domain-containing protein [Chloroflexota bacterium]|nr:carboxypeptidase-like regulatory domain-containing protein [Chloroflexota bacterium]
MSASVAGSGLVAHLIHDTRAMLPLAGVRNIKPRARRLLFAAEEFEVVLQISPERSANRLRVMGQVTAVGAPVVGAVVRICSFDRFAEQVSDENGEFRIGDLPRGAYWLEIATGGRLIEFSTLDLEAGPTRWMNLHGRGTPDALR